MGGIEEGILGNLITALIISTTKNFVGRYKRLNEVSRAFEGDRRTLPRSVSTAIDDVTVYLGTWRGELTKAVANFLSDVRDSGLAVKMCEAELCDTDPPGISAAFKILFEQHGLADSSDSNWDEMYKKLRRMLAASVAAQASTDPDWYIRASSRRVRQTLDAVDRRLSQMFLEKDSEILAKVRLADPEKIRTSAKKIAAALKADFEKVWVLGPDGRNRLLELDSIYIPTPTLEWNELQSERYIGAPETTDLLDVTKLVILGDPGSGKSTLAQLLALQFSRACVTGDGPLAVRIKIREFNASRVGAPQLSLLDFIQNEVCRLTGIEEEEVHETIKHLLIFGQLLLVFDGLDEVLDIGARKDFVSMVQNMVANYPLCRFIVTSRIVGYSKVPLENFGTTYIQPLREADVISLARRLWLVLGTDSDERASEIVGDFVEKTRHASDLIASPLLVTLMIWLYRELGQRIPQNKTKVYEECAILLYKRWDAERKIIPDIPRDFEFFHLLMDLADEIYSDAELNAGVGRDWLEDFVTKFFADYYNLDQRRRAKVAANKVCDYLIDRAWVMTETGSGIYNFTHRTFLEYFFALKIDDSYSSAPEMIKDLGTKISQGQWHIPLHLALQKKIGFRKRVAEEACISLIEVMNEADSAEALETSSFALQALEYITGAEKYIENLAHAAAKRRLEYISNSTKLYLEEQITTWIEPLSKNEYLNRDSVLVGYAALISGLFDHNSYRDLGFVADAFQYSQLWNVRNQMLSEGRPRVKRNAEHVLWVELGQQLNRVKSRVQKDRQLLPFQSKAYFDIFGVISPGLISDGISDIWNTSSYSGRKRINWIFVDLVHMANAVLGRKKWSRDDAYVKLAKQLSAAEKNENQAEWDEKQDIAVPALQEISELAVQLLKLRDTSPDAINWYLISGISRMLWLMGSGLRDDDQFRHIWPKLFSVAKGGPFDRWGSKNSVRFFTIA